MRILINGMSARLGGGITVLRNLLPALLEADGGRHEYVLVAHRDAAALINPGSPRVVVESTSDEGSLGARLFREQVGIPLRALADRVDLVFSPGGLAVFAALTPQVLMYQNMAPFEPRVVARTPEHERRRFYLLRELGLVSGRVARRLVFISRYAQRSILPLIGGRALDSRCIHLGRDPIFRPEAAAGAPALRARFGLPERYLLSVSQFYFYKNFIELVDAFALALPSIPEDVVLVIAGAEHEAGYAAEVRGRVAHHRIGHRVRFLGSVPYTELPALYAGALACVFPSTVENFPNILVEGMASGAPTFASKLGPMPEIAGDGAAYFDPYDVDDIARSLVTACSDARLRGELRERGMRRVERYSWGATGRALLEVFEEVG